MIRENRELLQYISKLHATEAQNDVMRLDIQPGDEILQQNKKVFAAYFVKEGLAKCYLTEDNGKDFIQEFFGKGELFGEIEVIKDSLTFCSIEALTKMVVYKISKVDFHNLLIRDKTFNSLIINALASKVRYTALRHSYNQSHTTEDNFMRLQKAYPDLLTKISKQDIANYLGITLRSLNRTLTELKEK